jgi:hypothetical protein
MVSIAVEFDDGPLVASLRVGAGNDVACLPIEDQDGGICSLTINDSLLAIFNPTNCKNSGPIIVIEKSTVKWFFEKVNKAKRELAQRR